MNTNEEINWLDWGFKSAFSGITFVGWWLWSNLMDAVKQQRKDISDLDGRIRDHQLEDSRIYVTEARFRDTVQEMKETVKRTHDRIDAMSKDMGDIKVLILQTITEKLK